MAASNKSVFGRGSWTTVVVVGTKVVDVLATGLVVGNEADGTIVVLVDSEVRSSDDVLSV
jgi:hypothetical protein